MRIRRSCSIAVVLSLLIAPAALARDLCVKDAGGTTRLTIRGWKPPRAGRCRSFAGTGETGLALGTVCLSTDGEILRVIASIQRQSGLFVMPYTDSTAFGLDYPGLSNGFGASVTRVTWGDDTVTSHNWSALQASLCTGEPID